MSDSASVHDLFSLDGKVAIVAGGVGKLGSQMCDALAEAGARVVVASRDIDGCRGKTAELTERGGEALAVKLDVTDASSVESMVREVLDGFGTIDILVNSAHACDAAPFETMSAEEWDSVFDTTLKGTFLCSQAVSKPMIERHSGVIVNLGSIYGTVAPDQRIYGRTGINSPANYGAAKAGVIQLTRWLAAYLAPHGIRVNCLSPGGFYNEDFRDVPDYEETFVRNYVERTPLGRMGDDLDLKGPLVFLASEASRWMTGQNLHVDGGWTIW